MAPTKLTSTLLPLWNVLEKYNQDSAAIFRSAGIDPETIFKDGTRNGLHLIDPLYREATRQVQDPCFGLKIAENWHPSHFGTLGYALLSSKTLRITLERLVRFHRVISDFDYGSITENKVKGLYTLTLRYNENNSHPAAREDAAMSWIMSVLRVNYQAELSPVKVEIHHDKPSCSGRYYEFFQAPVSFNCSHSAIHLPLSIVDQQLAGYNKQIDEFGEEMIVKYLNSLTADDLTARVKKQIIEHLPSGDATVDKVASELFFSTRTLQRMLKQENVSFLKLLNDTRRDLAVEYVKNEEMDLTEIAFLLGFSELSTFSRSFKRWTGNSPVQFRKAA